MICLVVFLSKKDINPAYLFSPIFQFEISAVLPKALIKLLFVDIVLTVTLFPTESVADQFPMILLLLSPFMPSNEAPMLTPVI